MTTRNRVGFTLVELLVVIAIIVVLVSLLVPALLGARSRARVVTCTNNLWELSSAVLQYDSVKQRLPGVKNKVGTATEVPWVPVLFPYFDRKDMWEGTWNGTTGSKGWRTGTPDAAVKVRIGRLVCPDDQPTIVSALTYVVNTARFLDYSAGTTNATSLSDVTSPTQTVMLSEQINTARDYSIYNPSMGFTWLATGKVNSVLPPIHPGIVIVSFCDGHVVSVADDVDCNLYFP